ncbi:cytidine deaminase [Salidesulfovibrio brasiliensis]|uniref:cytidine deaminase n=1 Tax=Salidesulfovibrio brasiliensis TaxID=221711 RepID=UPI0006D28292|nr:cytidine deaminase [Salidesulfovibrio brasiliensis]
MGRIDESVWEDLVAEARVASKNAYCPESGLAVGAALLMPDGRMVPGSNVENASFGLTNCAERTAVFSAVTGGLKPGEARAIAVYTPTLEPVSPCGACRQVMSEFFSPRGRVRAVCDGPEIKEWTVSDLLPDAFTFRKAGDG